MATALALLIILAVSLLVMRTSGTVPRLTDMPLDVAFFQSISARTGAGFTTQETEPPVSGKLRPAAGNFVLCIGAPTDFLALTAAKISR